MTLVKPSENFARSVQPASRDYLADPLNERLAIAAAGAIDRHLDRTFEYYKNMDQSRLSRDGSRKAFRAALFSRCPALRAMWKLSSGAHRSRGPAFAETLKIAIDFWRHWQD
jgi:hypothetical protein